MQLVIELREAITTLAGERAWNETRERWLERAARRGGVSYRQAKSMFYGEGNPRAETVDRVRAALRKRQEAEARDELDELRARIARLEQYLVTTDPDMAGAQVTALRDSIGGLVGTARAEDSAVAERGE